MEARAEEPRPVYELVTGRPEKDRLDRITYTAEEVGELIGCSGWSVNRMAREGLIPVLRVGNRNRFPKAAIHRWAEKAALAAVGME